MRTRSSALIKDKLKRAQHRLCTTIHVHAAKRSFRDLAVDHRRPLNAVRSPNHWRRCCSNMSRSVVAGEEGMRFICKGRYVAQLHRIDDRQSTPGKLNAAQRIPSRPATSTFHSMRDACSKYSSVVKVAALTKLHLSTLSNIEISVIAAPFSEDQECVLSPQQGMIQKHVAAHLQDNVPPFSLQQGVNSYLRAYIYSLMSTAGSALNRHLSASPSF